MTDLVRDPSGRAVVEHEVVAGFVARPGAFILVDADLRVRWAASYLHASRGVDGTALGLPVADVLRPSDGLDENWFLEVRDGHSARHTVVDDDGRWSLHASPVAGTDGRTWVGVELTVVEGWDQVEARTSTVLDLVTDGAQVGTWAWNRITGDIEWNAWHARLFGHPAVAGLWRHEDFAERIHPDDLPGLVGAIFAAADSGELYQHEFRVVHPDGTVRHVRGQGRVVAGDPFRMVGIAVDVTESVEAAERERRLLHRLADADRRARVALAADMHDGPIQQLFVAKLTAGALLRTITREEPHDERAVRRLERLLDAVDRAQTGLRTLLVELAGPVGGEPSALGPELERIATATFADHPCAVVLDGDVDAPVPSLAAHTSMQIAGEALLNVRKHAAASLVRVHATVTEVELVLTVQDDGTGFDVESPGPVGHYGRGAMAARAEAAGGTLVTQSAPGGGTTVTLRLPMLATRP